ncbi:MAG: metallophosphoesterase [Candidatus Micrarchaeaceae archaeon]
MRFVYGSPTMLIGKGNSLSLVAGDIHIGLENKLRKAGIRLYDLAAHMAQNLLSTATEFGARRLILLGDIKDEVLHPDSSGRFAMKNFFNILSPLQVRIVRGNHDAYLSDIIDIPVADEIIAGGFSLLHGNSWPSEKAMKSNFLITAHNHAAVLVKDLEGRQYTSKVWLIADIDQEEASKRYKKFNSGMKMVIMPAYNDMITGTPVNSVGYSGLGPLLANKVFDIESSAVYSLAGEYLGTVSELKNK